MDNKRAFTDYMTRRQAEHRKEQIMKQKRIENQLDSFALEGREKARRSHYNKGRRAVN